VIFKISIRIYGREPSTYLSISGYLVELLRVFTPVTESKVSDDFKVSLQSDNPFLKCPFNLLDSSFRCREAS